MLWVGAAVVIIMVADELCFVSSGGRLLFASTTPEFIQKHFKSDEILYLVLSPLCTSLSRPPLSVQAVSTRILLCKLNGNGEKGNAA